MKISFRAEDEVELQRDESGVGWGDVPTKMWASPDVVIKTRRKLPADEAHVMRKHTRRPRSRLKRVL